MYVDPFIAGVVTTIMAEIVVAFIAAISAAWRKAKKDD